MSLKDKLTSLANSTRNVSGIRSKLSINDISEVVSHLIAFKDHGVMNDGTDIDTLQDPGTYSIREAKNKPIPNWGSLIVIKANTRRIQFYIADNAATFVRALDNGVVSYTWQKLGGG